MWTSVYMTQDIEKAKKLRVLLEKNSIIVMLRRIYDEDGLSQSCYELLVPAAELEEALCLIIDE